MREIKFRAWNKDTKQFHRNGFCIEPDGSTHYYEQGCVVPIDLEVNFYVGLKDKNGIEIYEADIVRLIADDGKEIEVFCEYGINRRDNLDIPSFYFKTKSGYGSYPIVSNYLGKHDLELFEVIGNIYENPELLTPQ